MRWTAPWAGSWTNYSMLHLWFDFPLFFFFFLLLSSFLFPSLSVSFPRLLVRLCFIYVSLHNYSIVRQSHPHSYSQELPPLPRLRVSSRRAACRRNGERRKMKKQDKHTAFTWQSSRLQVRRATLETSGQSSAKSPRCKQGRSTAVNTLWPEPKQCLVWTSPSSKSGYHSPVESCHY